MSEKQMGYQPPPPRERLVDRVWADFHDVNMQLTAGLQAVLESQGVSAEARRAAGEYMGEVVRGLAAMEAGIVGIINGYERDAGKPLIDPKEHGHTSLASLFAEMRGDEAAGKRQDAHLFPMGLDGKAEPEKERDDGRGR